MGDSQVGRGGRFLVQKQQCRSAPRLRSPVPLPSSGPRTFRNLSTVSE
jgi:hypothetical protein